MTFSAEVARRSDAAVVVMKGDLDIASEALATAQLERAMDGCGLLIADLRELAFLDSTGVRVLLSAHLAGTGARAAVRVVRGDGMIARCSRSRGSATLSGRRRSRRADRRGLVAQAGEALGLGLALRVALGAALLLAVLLVLLVVLEADDPDLRRSAPSRPSAASSSRPAGRSSRGPRSWRRPPRARRRRGAARGPRGAAA
jgi:anti-anti-sigma factor